MTSKYDITIVSDELSGFVGPILWFRNKDDPMPYLAGFTTVDKANNKYIPQCFLKADMVPDQQELETLFDPKKSTLRMFSFQPYQGKGTQYVYSMTFKPDPENDNLTNVRVKLCNDYKSNKFQEITYRSLFRTENNKTIVFSPRTTMLSNNNNNGNNNSNKKNGKNNNAYALQSVVFKTLMDQNDPGNITLLKAKSKEIYYESLKKMSHNDMSPIKDTGIVITIPRNNNNNPNSTKTQRLVMQTQAAPMPNFEQMGTVVCPFATSTSGSDKRSCNENDGHFVDHQNRQPTTTNESSSSSFSNFPKVSSSSSQSSCENDQEQNSASDECSENNNISSASATSSSGTKSGDDQCPSQSEINKEDTCKTTGGIAGINKTYLLIGFGAFVLVFFLIFFVWTMKSSKKSSNNRHKRIKANSDIEEEEVGEQEQSSWMDFHNQYYDSLNNNNNNNNKEPTIQLNL
jgi:hypothetical protein